MNSFIICFIGADATKAAFRDGLRNLLHIDLYDNYGLAHDVHGKC